MGPNFKAFTIIEVLIVLTVLGILIGIAVPKIKGMQQNGNVIKANKELAAIEAALESYHTFVPSHSYPIQTSVYTNLQLNYLLHANPNMIATILYDPFATTPTEYSYMSSSNGQYYMIWSASLAGPNPPTGIDNTGKVSY